MEAGYRAVENVLEQYICPQLKVYGGSVQLADLRQHTVYIRPEGVCSRCPSAPSILRGLIRRELAKHTDNICEVVITDRKRP